MNRMALPLHLTCSSEWHNPIQGWKTLNHNEERFMHLHLTWKELNPLAMNRMAQPLHLTYSSEWLSILALISDMEGTESSRHDRMAQPLHLTSSSEWLWDTS